MAVSIRDIAREAGVTVGTVSRALNNYPDVSPTTRARIVETAQRLGYRPNQMARNLSSKHNHNIALVLSGFLEEELINDFEALLMKGCFHYTVNNDVEMSIQVINTKIQAEKSFEQLCYEHNIAGAILADFTPPPMDEGRREELAAFVARRKAEGGAPTDF